MNGDDELIALADGSRDLIVMSDGVTMHTHGPDVCLGPHCCIHNPSDHPLRTAPMVWFPSIQVMFRVCKHEQGHPDPDGMEYRMLLSLAGRAPWYDGWHPCCEGRCCQSGDDDDA